LNGGGDFSPVALSRVVKKKNGNQQAPFPGFAFIVDCGNGRDAGIEIVFPLKGKFIKDEESLQVAHKRIKYCNLHSTRDFSMNQKTLPAPYWSHTPVDLFTTLQSSPQGLSSVSAQERLTKFGRNELQAHKKAVPLLLLLSQFKSPLVLILVFAAIISVITGEWIDASIILAIVLASAILGFIQEYTASHAVEKLRAQVTIKATVLRDGLPQPTPAEEVVPGDILLLSAGSLIPADGIVLDPGTFSSTRRCSQGRPSR
jgi:magnesium-transporting ATPase (P-type)